MPTALDTDTGLQVVPLWINGAPTKASKEATFPVYSSAQQKNVYLAQSADVEAAVAAADSAQRAFEIWKRTPAASRRDIVLRLAELIKQRQEELIKVQVEEASCSESWAKFNIGYTLNAMAEIAARITTACTGELPPMSTDGTLGLLVKEHRDSAADYSVSIQLWSICVILAIRSIASILGVGCSMVFKASELCPRTHHLLLELYMEAGVPPDVINVVQTRREDAPAVTEALIGHRGIRKVEFIGSAPVGRVIGSLAGKYLKPVLMELGGKCAAIVLEDANLEDAASKTISGALIHHGQVCFSTERIKVLQKVADHFIELLKKAALEYPQSRGVNTRIVRNSYDMLSEAHEKGAKFILGKPEYLSETSLAPALVTGVTKDMKMWDEEMFGPSTTIVVVENENQAITVVNESKYGLDAFLFTRDMKRAVDIAYQLEVGRVRVNGPAHEATFPSNPVKGSGFGANNSDHGIEEFLLKKVITLDFR